MTLNIPYTGTQRPDQWSEKKETAQTICNTNLSTMNAKVQIHHNQGPVVNFYDVFIWGHIVSYVITEDTAY